MRLVGKAGKVNKFFDLNLSLDGSQVSFGYFEHFPKQSIDRPFDLMAKCLFRGSAITLNNSFPGIDLMIPLVLRDGDISFLGIKVKYVKEENVKIAVEGALEEMKFSKIFKGCQNDRPIALMVLALGKYPAFRDGIEVEVFHSACQDPLEAPAVLSLKGISRFETYLFDLAPNDIHFRGINTTHLVECDRLYDLTQEIPALDGSATSSSESEGPGSKRSRPQDFPDDSGSNSAASEDRDF